jgi:hypothetical protein
VTERGVLGDRAYALIEGHGQGCEREVRSSLEARAWPEGRLLDREGTTAAPVYGHGSGQASGRELKLELRRKKLRDQFMLTDCGPYRCR